MRERSGREKMTLLHQIIVDKCVCVYHNCHHNCDRKSFAFDLKSIFVGGVLLSLGAVELGNLFNSMYGNVWQCLPHKDFA